MIALAVCRHLSCRTNGHVLPQAIRLRWNAPRSGDACSLAARQLSTSRPASAARPPRVYRYAIDVHGQLFLHDTVPKNLTSCFKNPEFLNFFMTRIKPNEPDSDGENEAAGNSDVVKEALQDPEWPERSDLTLEAAFQIARLQGYHWISPCQGEHNFVRAADSPIVFRELSEDGTLTWAGNLTHPFDPSKLKVDPETGYVYHPSPVPPLRSVQRRVSEAASPIEEAAANPFNTYSLLSSALVLQRLATGLDLDPDQFDRGAGGSVEWKGQRYEMGILSDADAVRHRRHRVDNRD